MDSQAVCLSDDLTDDYECLEGGLPKLPHEDESVLYVPGLRSSNSGDLILRSEGIKPLMHSKVDITLLLCLHKRDPCYTTQN